MSSRSATPAALHWPCHKGEIGPCRGINGATAAPYAKSHHTNRYRTPQVRDLTFRRGRLDQLQRDTEEGGQAARLAKACLNWVCGRPIGPVRRWIVRGGHRAPACRHIAGKSGPAASGLETSAHGSLR